VRGLLGYVPYGYDSIVVVNFLVNEFVRVGVYNQRCCHSCNVEWPEVGIASRGIFGAALGDKFLLNQ
jgi:hypothetical protein